jgi:hypothetical protein
MLKCEYYNLLKELYNSLNTLITDLYQLYYFIQNAIQNKRYD